MRETEHSGEGRVFKKSTPVDSGSSITEYFEARDATIRNAVKDCEDANFYRCYVSECHDSKFNKLSVDGLGNMVDPALHPYASCPGFGN